MGAIERAGRWPIAALEPADAPALCALSEEAGWNQVTSDWRLMLALGRGFGVRDEQGGWLGSALTLPLGPSLCWISMVLVTRRVRGQGLGTELLVRCLAAAESLPAQAGLDATEFGRPIYLPLGFGDLFTLARWHWPQPARRPVPAPAGLRVRAAEAQDLASIIAHDKPRSGFCREAILAALLSRSAPFAQVAVASDGALAGFVLGRDGHKSWHLGPVVADDEATALALLSAAAASLNEPLIVDIPDCHRRLQDWLHEGGATAPRRYTRMLRGANITIADSARLFALAGPELG
jgi:GNAT superfamily N-acetyltransferase